MAPTTQLDDLVWMEIMCRLPSIKHVSQCKSVSKYWNSLISDRYFISRFIDHHHGDSTLDRDYLLLFHHMGFLASWDGEGTNQVGPIIPWGDVRRSLFDRVKCSFNDLLLCSESRTFYIVNALTKEHVHLPIPPQSDNWNICGVGFICEPFYAQGRGQFGLKANYRYRVIRVVGSNRVEIYFAETRKWMVREGDRDGFNYRCNSNIVAHDGKLFWYNNSNRKVVVYDTFVETGEPFFYLLGFDEGGPWKRTRGPYKRELFFLAKSQGSLLLMHFPDCGNLKSFDMWKLGRHDDHEVWCFQRKVSGNDFISDSSPSFLRRVAREDNLMRVLGIHPNNQNIIFVGYSLMSSQIMYVNLKTKEWRLVGEIHHRFLNVEHSIIAAIPMRPKKERYHQNPAINQFSAFKE